MVSQEQLGIYWWQSWEVEKIYIEFDAEKFGLKKEKQTC